MGGRQPGADRAALAAAELAVVFGLITIVTGPLWGRKAWGVWWAWEPRLTSTLVMWLLFGAYTLVRRFGGAGSEMLSAAVGMFGMALVPFVYWSVNFWRTLHPKTTVLPTLPASMGMPLWWSFVAFAFLFAALMALRMRVEQLRGLVGRRSRKRKVNDDEAVATTCGLLALSWSVSPRCEPRPTA